MTVKFLIGFFIVFLLSACGNSSPGGSDAVYNIKIYTGALGNENDPYPQDIIDLWSELTIHGKKAFPIIELQRVDQEEIIKLAGLDNGDDDLVRPDPDVRLDREKEDLKQRKISAEFSAAKPTNFSLAKQRIDNYANKSNIVFLKSNVDGNSNFNNPQQALRAIESKAAQALDIKEQEYVIVYNIADSAKITVQTPPVKIDPMGNPGANNQQLTSRKEHEPPPQHGTHQQQKPRPENPASKTPNRQSPLKPHPSEPKIVKPRPKQNPSEPPTVQRKLQQQNYDDTPPSDEVKDAKSEYRKQIGRVEDAYLKK